MTSSRRTRCRRRLDWPAVSSVRRLPTTKYPVCWPILGGSTRCRRQRRDQVPAVAEAERPDGDARAGGVGDEEDGAARLNAAATTDDAT